MAWPEADHESATGAVGRASERSKDRLKDRGRRLIRVFIGSSVVWGCSIISTHRPKNRVESTLFIYRTFRPGVLGRVWERGGRPWGGWWRGCWGGPGRRRLGGAGWGGGR